MPNTVSFILQIKPRLKTTSNLRKRELTLDAHGQRICLYYDGLNRLSGKPQYKHSVN